MGKRYNIHQDIGINMLSGYLAGTGVLLEGSKNMDSSQIDYYMVKILVRNYKQILDKFKKIIGKDETNIHEEAIGKLERFFEITN